MANDRPRIEQEMLRPTAAPTSIYTGPPRSGLRDLATSLSSVDRELDTFIKNRAEKFRADEAIRGEAAFRKRNAEGYAEGVRSGAIPAQASGSFTRAYKQSEGALAGQRLKDAYGRAYNAWDGKYSDDPAAYDEFLSGFVAEHVQTDDPDILRGLLPHLREVEQNGFAQHSSDVSKATYSGSLDSHVAQANRDVEEGAAEGLVSGEGTDYPAVFAAVAVRRESFVASGGSPEDFDKTMMDAMSAKVLSTRDTGLLAWFDQKVPGKDYTYGESPYGQKVRDQTVSTLEVINRQNMSGEAARQKKLDDDAKEAAWSEAISILADDPAAVLPDELVARGRKYDPKFLVNIEEWRGSFDGFTDPKALKEVYADVMSGGGIKAVRDAATNGSFGKMSDMVAAMNFAKSFEDNKGRIEETLGSSGARSVLEAIDVRTKGVTAFGQPVGGTSNEGFEAQFDFKRMVQEWVVNNPEASLQEREEAIGKIGQTILKNTPQADIMQPGQYNQPVELLGRFNNPYSPQPPPPEPEAPAPTATSQPEGEATPTLSREQMKAVNDLAQTQGVDPSVILERLGMGDVQMPSQADALPKTEDPQQSTPEPGSTSWREMLFGPSGSATGNARPWVKEAMEREQSDRTDIPEEGQAEDEEAKFSPISFKPDLGDDGQLDSRESGLSFEQAQGFLDEAITASTNASPILAGQPGASLVGSDPLAAHLQNFISKYEAAGNYNAVYGNSRSTKDLSKYTLDGILTQQQAARRAGKKSTAIGIGQFLHKTLRGLKDELGLTGKERFTPELQDRLFHALLVRRGLEQYKAGKLSKGAFAKRLSQEWAALPNPETGRSYYAGDGLNKSGVSTAKVYRALGFTGRGPSLGELTPAANTDVVYANIPEAELEQFRTWNPDPIGNHEKYLSEVDPDLAKVVRNAQKLSSVQFVVGSGKRTPELQAKAKEWGWSKTDHSDHLDGSAVDLWPLDGAGAVTFTPSQQKAVMKAMRQSAKELGIALDVGGNWKSFKDRPHFGIKKPEEKKTKSPQERTV